MAARAISAPAKRRMWSPEFGDEPKIMIPSRLRGRATLQGTNTLDARLVADTRFPAGEGRLVVSGRRQNGSPTPQSEMLVTPAGR